MAQEIENLRQLSIKRDIFHSLAAKRERQHGLLGEQLGQGSITRDLRIAEVMERTLDRWGKVTERAESLGQTLSEETEKVTGQLQRLKDIGSRNLTVYAVYEPYQAEFDSFRSGQPTPQTTLTEKNAGPVPKPKPIPTETETVTAEGKKRYEIELSPENIFITESEKVYKLMQMLKDGQFTMRELSIALYGTNTSDARSNASAMIARSRPRLKEMDWKVNKVEEVDGALYGLVRIREQETTSDQPTQPAAGEPEPVAAEEPERTEEETLTLGRRPYLKESIIPDFYEKKSRVVELPNGITIEIDSAWTYHMSHYINQRTNTLRQIALQVYGISNDITKGRISAAIPKINHVLKDTGVSVKFIRGKIEGNERLPSRIEFVINGEIIPTVTEQPVETAIYQPKPKPTLTPKPAAATPAASRPSPRLAGVIEKPYEPTPEEIRTTEETRIVVAITAALTKSERIYFDELQRSLRTNERIKVRTGQRMYKPYQAYELKKLFESGLGKLREESGGANLRGNWTEEELTTWENTQALVYRMTEDNNFDGYVRRIRKLIDESERAFRETHGNTPEWLTLGNGAQI